MPTESWAPQIERTLGWGVVPPSLWQATGREFKGTETCGHAMTRMGILLKTCIFGGEETATYFAITASHIKAINTSFQYPNFSLHVCVNFHSRSEH